MDNQAGKTIEQLVEEIELLMSRIAILEGANPEYGQGADFLRVIIENSSDITLVVDNDGKIKYASRSVWRWLGYRPQEVLGKSGFSFIHPDDIPRAMQDLSRVVREKDAVISDIFRVRHGDGSERIFETLSSNLLGDPAIRGILMNGRDVTEHRRAQEKAEVFERFAENAGQGLGMATLDGKITYVNPALCRLFEENSPNDAMKKSIWDYYPAETHDYVKAEVLPTVIKKGQWVGESVIVSNKGNRIPVIENIFIISDDLGNPQYFANVMTNISLRKKSEEEILFKTTILEGQSEASLDGIFVVDDKGIVGLTNKRFLKMWDIPEDVLAQKDSSALLHHALSKLKFPEKFISKVRHLNEHKDERSDDITELKDGRFFHRYSAPLIDPNGDYRGRVWYFRDITESRKMEEERERHLHNLEVFYKSSMGREQRILELKNKMQELEERLKKQ